MASREADSPIQTNSIRCNVCGTDYALQALRPGWSAHCHRCGSTLARRVAADLQFAAAFSIAALALYWPANAFPILRMNMHGATTENTVWQGCVRLYQSGDATIAVIVFLASMVIPFLKLLGLMFLMISTRVGSTRWKKARTRIYRTIELLGRWAMLDVFVVAILVSLVKLQRLATVLPGKGLVAFTGVVVFTLLASFCFDPALIWEAAE